MILATVLGGAYLVVAAIVTCSFLSWEHMGDSGVEAMFRKRRSEWRFGIGLGVGWLPLLLILVANGLFRLWSDRRGSARG